MLKFSYSHSNCIVLECTVPPSYFSVWLNVIFLRGSLFSNSCYLLIIISPTLIIFSNILYWLKHTKVRNIVITSIFTMLERSRQIPSKKAQHSES